MKIYSLKYKVDLSPDRQDKIQQKIRDDSDTEYHVNDTNATYNDFYDLFDKWDQNDFTKPVKITYYVVESAPVNSMYFITYNEYQNISTAKSIAKKLHNENRYVKLYKKTITLNSNSVFKIIKQSKQSLKTKDKMYFILLKRIENGKIIPEHEYKELILELYH